MPEVVSSTPTSSLKFIGGKLHQLCIVATDDGVSAPKWVEVPSEQAPAPAGEGGGE